MLTWLRNKFYYIDDSGNEIVLSLPELGKCLGIGSEGTTVYRLGNLAFKIFDTAPDNPEEEYENFKSFTKLRNIIVPKHLLHVYDRTDQFCGYTSTFVQKINGIANFRCSSLLTSVDGLLNDAADIGRELVIVDSTAVHNYIFGEDALYYAGSDKWKNDTKTKHLSIDSIVKVNRLDFSKGIAKLLKSPDVVGTAVSSRIAPICDDFLFCKCNIAGELMFDRRIEESKRFHHRLVSELGPYPTLGDYGANRRR